MDDWQDLDPAIEAEGRRLLTAAFATSLAGPVPGGAAQADHEWAGHEWADAERLRRQVRRRISRRRRVRTLVPVGAVVALGGAVALALTLAATVASAPSALAAVTAAAAKTSALSFRVTSTRTAVLPSGARPPVRITGVFDPGRGLGEAETVIETTEDAKLHMRIVGGHIYAELTGSTLTFFRQRSHGKPWIESPLPPPEPAASLGLVDGFDGDEPIDPTVLLGMLKSAASVQAEGPASGPGWAGTEYAFTEPPPKGVVISMTVSGTVYVDTQGRVRRVVTKQTRTMRLTDNTIGTATVTDDVTFGEFGVRVSVTPPPASQVYDLGNEYLYINAGGGLGYIPASLVNQATGLSPHS